jgi:excinuclease ABC subunit C
MVSEIVDIKTIVVNNEKESLILETTLIKKHKPKYNILMKDDKNHLYIKITDEIIPKVVKTRSKTIQKTPYPPLSRGQDSSEYPLSRGQVLCDLPLSRGQVLCDLPLSRGQVSVSKKNHSLSKKNIDNEIYF